MTSEEAAALLGVSVAEVLQLASEGEIPRAVLNARGWHFALEGLERYMKRRDRGAAA